MIWIVTLLHLLFVGDGALVALVAGDERAHDDVLAAADADDLTVFAMSGTKLPYLTDLRRYVGYLHGMRMGAILSVMAQQIGIPYVDFGEKKPDPTAVAVVPNER